MKRIILFFLLIVNTISLSAQSEEWKEYCQLQLKAQSAFKKGDYQKASKSYSQMDSVYGKIVDYADMRNFCIAAANIGDTSLVRKTLMTITGYKCFDLAFFNNPIFNAYKEKDWWTICDSLSHIYGHKNQFYIDTLRRMQYRDSIIRYQFVHAADKTVRDSARLIMRSTDSVNTIILTKLISEHGLPTWKNLGYEGFHRAYIVMMHVDQQLQDKLIEQFIPLMDEGLIPRDKMAYLIDRQLIRQRLPQRYACQVYRGGKYEPIEDIENLNARRESMWLQPVDIEKTKANIVEYE